MRRGAGEGFRRRREEAAHGASSMHGMQMQHWRSAPQTARRSGGSRPRGRPARQTGTRRRRRRARCAAEAERPAGEVRPSAGRACVRFSLPSGSPSDSPAEVVVGWVIQPVLVRRIQAEVGARHAAAAATAAEQAVEEAAEQRRRAGGCCCRCRHHVRGAWAPRGSAGGACSTCGSGRQATITQRSRHPAGSLWQAAWRASKADCGASGGRVGSAPASAEAAVWRSTHH